MANAYKIYLITPPLMSLKEPSSGLLGEIQGDAEFGVLYKINGKHYDLFFFDEDKKYAGKQSQLSAKA